MGDKKINGIKAKKKIGELGEKCHSLIEAIVNSLKEKKENELIYNDQSIFDDSGHLIGRNRQVRVILHYD